MSATGTTLTIRRVGDDVVIDWLGGVPPFKLQSTAALQNTTVWNDVGNPTMNRTSQQAINGTAFFRVQEQIVMALNASPKPGSVHLYWESPD